VSHNSGENEWYTPSVIIGAAREVLGGIALDPASCAEANEVVQADRYYDAETNGLMQPWVGTVWLNPPYSQPLIAQFVNKLLAERDNIKAAITLTNNGTETGYGQSLLALCDAVCFPDKRIKFTNGDGESTGSPLQGQMICYFGSDRDRFRQCFQFRGRVLYDAH
jgi:ParB family chromosome partitioning protein